MIKKVIIKNYGPFKNAKINLENKTSVVHIIGMNDVGKTVLLNAIKSSATGLNKKFGITENTSVETIIEITKPEYYFDKELIKKMSDEQITPYTGELIFKTNKSEYNRFTNIFFSNSKINDWMKIFLNKINSYLSQNNKIDSENITDDYLNEKKDKIKQKQKPTKKDHKAINLIEILKKFKSSIYNFFENRFLMLAADSKDHFDFIKPVYIIKDSTDENGEPVKSDWEHIDKFIKSFFTKKEVDDFKNIIIYSDLSEDEKKRKITKYEKKINENMKSFFDKYFPTQNKELSFSFSFWLSNKIQILVKDKSDSDYDSLNSRSDGFKWFLKLYIMTKNTKDNSVIIIDEPEKFLHPSAQKELVKLWKDIKLKKRVQIFYATHSPFMLTDSIYESLKWHLSPGGR